jgi:HIP---CoA ligase
MNPSPLYPESQTIPEMLRHATSLFGPKCAIECDGREISFDALLVQIRQAARALIQAGVGHGDRVAIWAPNLPEWIYAALGVHHIGGILVPINTRFKGAEAGYVLEKSGASILFTVDGFLGSDYVNMLNESMGPTTDERPVAGLPHLKEIVVLRGRDRNENTRWEDFLTSASGTSEDTLDEMIQALTPNDVSDILFTSGTTGHPKGVMTTHAQNLRAFTSWTEVVGLQSTDRYLIVNPFFHAFGYKAGWLSALMRGSTILPHLVFDAAAVAARVAEDSVTMLPGPPALYQSILALPELEDYDLRTLRLAVTGAAVIPVELIRRMRDELHFQTVITGYGLTEACGIATMCRFDDDPETIATTSGRAIDDVEVQVVDEAGAEEKPGTPGEIVVRGYNVMLGYFDDAAQTEDTIDADGWLHTGDIGVMDARGYIRITDRKKDMFIMGGFNCYPAEIENLMLQNRDFAAVAVIGVPHERMGEVGMAFVVSRDGLQLTPSQVIVWCREHIANYKVPRFVRIVDSLPRNALGKVQKFILREQVNQTV